MNDYDYFTLSYDPNPSGRFRTVDQGYWFAKSVTGHVGDGLTPQDALAHLVISMAKDLKDYQDGE